MAITDNLDRVEHRIAEACKRSGRAREDVQVIAVTKYASLQTAEQLLQHGVQHIGESRWPDAEQKRTTIGDRAVWHFIGHLQTNKVRHVIDRFTYFHSLDRLSLAKELEKRAKSLDIEVKCFLQVNVSGEKSKHGCSPEDLFTFAEQVSQRDHLRIVGLMTMAPYEAKEQEIRQQFRTLRELKDELNKRAIFTYELEHLSMGMSNDFEIAVEEGATWIRLGSILVQS